MSTHDSSTAILVPSEATAIACPRFDRGPVPGGTSTHGPVVGREQITVSPDVGGLPLHAQALGDLCESDGVTRFHTEDRSESLDTGQWCSDNHYMTKTETTYRLLDEISGTLTEHGEFDNYDEAVEMAQTVGFCRVIRTDEIDELRWNR